MCFFAEKKPSEVAKSYTPEAAGKRFQLLRDEIGKVLVGQHLLVDRLLIGLLTNGHILLEGVPGLAKTLTVRTLAQALHLDFSRIQFTPDLLPGDLLGTQLFNPQQGQFETRKGPVFANLVLADEINRAPAKVQSALLEAMQERQVTLGDETYPLPKPFLVLATQNPVEQAGTYPLPEAQLDRFLLKVSVSYPSRAEELEVVRRMAVPEALPQVNGVIEQQEIAHLRKAVEQVKLAPGLEEYIVDLVRATREPEAAGLTELKTYIEFGASPRASIALAKAAKAEALMQGHASVLPEHIKALAVDVLNHRILRTFEAEADEVSTAELVRRILAKVQI